MDGFHGRNDAREQAERERVSDPSECSPAEVDFVVVWREQTPTALSGIVTATNISRRAWRITGKPVAVMVAADGSELTTQHMVTLEGRFRDWIVVRAGASVSASISVFRWDGSDLADHFNIRWRGGSKAAVVHGPTHPPQRKNGPTTTSSSWFAPVNLALSRPRPRLDIDAEDVEDLESAGRGTDLSQIADFVLARLDDTSAALLQLHRERCRTPPTPFALDQDGSRYEPACRCDRDIRRSRADLHAQRQVAETASVSTAEAVSFRILQIMASTFADHPDFRSEWAHPT